MIYTKVKIAPGVELKIDVDPDEMYSACPICNVEIRWNYDSLEQLKGDWSSSATCGKPECNDQLRGIVRKEN